MLKLNGAWLCGLSSVPQGSGLSRLRSSVAYESGQMVHRIDHSVGRDNAWAVVVPELHCA
jgi:hypothetical protein